jgi:hypothetical protein
MLLNLIKEAIKLKVDSHPAILKATLRQERARIGSSSNFCNNRNKITKEKRVRVLRVLRIHLNLEMIWTWTNFQVLQPSNKLNSLTLKYRHSYSFRNCIRCRNWIKWHKCNSSGNKQSSYSVKILHSNNSGRFFNNLAIIKHKYKCKISNIKWCSLKASMEITCKF